MVYRVGTFIADAERCAANTRRFVAKPSGLNLIRVLVAEGVLLKDLGLPE